MSITMVIFHQLTSVLFLKIKLQAYRHQYIYKLYRYNQGPITA